MPFDFTKDPSKHVPVRDPVTHLIEAWGIPGIITDSDSEQDFMAGIQRRMASAFQGLGGAPPQNSDEIRYLTFLKDKKIAELKKYAKESGEVPCGRDYVFNVDFMVCKVDGRPLVSRQFRCSGDMNLRVWVDKVLVPVMGYSRGYRGWVLADQQDGAVFKPSIQTTDMQHTWAHGTVFIEDMDYTVAHVLRKMGDSFMWCYDLGDQYRHHITLRAILPIASGHSCEILGATGASPAEDFGGNHGWNAFLTRYLNSEDVTADLKKIHKSPNYMAGVGKLFTPENFFLDPRVAFKTHHQIELEEALESSTTNVNINNREQPFKDLPEPLLRKTDVCGGCGVANVGEVLKRCGRCEVSAYCGKDCQVKRWPMHKKLCKRFKARKAQTA